MKDAIRILFQEPTSFNDVDAWTKYEYTKMMQYSTTLSEADEYSFIRLGRSIPFDAFCALNRKEANPDDVLGVTWGKLMSDPSFPVMEEDLDRNIITILALAEAVQKAVFEHAEELYEAQEQEAQEQEAQDQGGEPGEGIGIDIGVILTAKGEADDTFELVSGVRGGMDGTTPSLRFEQSLEVARIFDVDLFAAILGWARMSTAGAIRENKEGREELTGYRLGEWSDDVDTYDMIGVANGDPTALLALAENALTQRKYRSIEPRGRGACVVLKDESTSMLEHAHSGMRKRDVANALELALSLIFNDQKRDLISVAWSDKVTRYDSEAITGTIPKTREYTYGTEGMLSHLQSFLRGGTNIAPALERGVNVAMEYADPCDILIISDLEFRGDGIKLSSQLSALCEDFRAAGGRVWAIFVGPDKPDDSYSVWLDGWVSSKDMKQDKEMGDLIAGMVKNAPTHGRKTRV